VSYSDILRDNLKTKRQTRDAKLRRIYAKPGQLSQEGGDLIVNPPGESQAAKNLREAKAEAVEARRLADEAKR
jgi:hypothetical protein